MHIHVYIQIYVFTFAMLSVKGMSATVILCICDVCPSAKLLVYEFSITYVLVNYFS